jgi:hypothetical protein
MSDLRLTPTRAAPLPPPHAHANDNNNNNNKNNNIETLSQAGASQMHWPNQSSRAPLFVVYAVVAFLLGMLVPPHNSPLWYPPTTSIKHTDAFRAWQWRVPPPQSLAAALAAATAAVPPLRSANAAHLSPSSTLIGRERELRRLDTRLFNLPHTEETASSPPPPSSVVVVTGAAGVGRSALAAEYARHRAGRYAAVVWLDASSRDTILASLVSLARWVL